MTHSNYPPDHDPRLDSGDDEIEEVPEFDDSDDWRENQPVEEDGELLYKDKKGDYTVRDIH